MQSSAEGRILSMLDVIAGQVGEVGRDLGSFRAEMYDFRAETNANFERIGRSLDHHETRIENVEQRVTSIEAS